MVLMAWWVVELVVLDSSCGGGPAPAAHSMAACESLGGSFEPGDVGIRVVGEEAGIEEVSEGVVDGDVDVSVDLGDRSLVVRHVVLNFTDVDRIERHALVFVAAVAGEVVAGDAGDEDFEGAPVAVEFDSEGVRRGAGSVEVIGAVVDEVDVFGEAWVELGELAGGHVVAVEVGEEVDERVFLQSVVQVVRLEFLEVA